MYLPNKITNILSKITKSYTVKYTNGKIESVFINEKDVMIQASNKGYCIYLKGGPIYLNDLKSIEPLLIKMNVLNNDYKSKHNKSINDDLIDIVQQIAIWYFTNDDQYKASEITNIEAKLATSTRYDSVDSVFNNWDLIENDKNYLAN